MVLPNKDNSKNEPGPLPSILDEKQKMKRLKTRKERSLMRGGWKETSNTKSHHHYCSRQCSVAPAVLEPSIITDRRLIGHQGLFNYEVKSIDIERLLSEQRKLKQSGQHVKEKYKASSHLSSSSCIPAPFSCDPLLGADTDDAVFVNCTSDRERRPGLQCCGANIQPFFSHQAQLPDRQPAEPTYFPQKQDPLTDNRYSFSPLFPAKIPNFYQSNSLFPFSQFLHPLACSPPRSHHTDMVHYPPSQMLERSTNPLSSLLSPVHWSFPAMRLY
uniref:Uncharacterized protein n=1 Tax=Amphiprion percula TaxID=161767 RepID=A0A3P8SNH1_AMPPE